MKKLIIFICTAIYVTYGLSEELPSTNNYTTLKPVSFEALEGLREQNITLLSDFLIIPDDTAIQDLYEHFLPIKSSVLYAPYKDNREDKWFLFKFNAGSEINPAIRWIDIAGIMREYDEKIEIIDTYKNWMSCLGNPDIYSNDIVLAYPIAPYFRKYELPLELICANRDVLLLYLEVFLRPILESGNYDRNFILDDFSNHSLIEKDKWDFIEECKSKPMYYYEIQGEDQIFKSYEEAGIVIDFDGKFIHVPFATIGEYRNTPSHEE